jgi:hypothetical protein
MRKTLKSLKSLGLLVALAVSVGAGASGAPAALADGCPNEQLRIENSSTGLPDCRAYELVTTDSNHAKLFLSGGRAAPDGDRVLYTGLDAPDNAQSSQPIGNPTLATRDAAKGWSGVALSPPAPSPVTAYASSSWTVSADFSTLVAYTDQPLSRGIVPAGRNFFIGHPDGPFRLISTVGATLIPGFNSYPPAELGSRKGTPDFSHFYFEPPLAQLPVDPVAGGYNAYSWSEAKGLRLLGILPNETPAPNGAKFAGVSDDGRYVLFSAEGELYLRVDEAHTVRVGESQRTVDPDPNPSAERRVVRITVGGSKVLFTSSSELTNDANTGEGGGVETDAGNDLYIYDIASGELTDLTVDTNPADAATGANVQTTQEGAQEVSATPDGSHAYFIAKGDLAAGATPGHPSLYAWHDGQIDFVAKADGIVGQGLPYYITPNGRHAVFTSTDSLTGYDNRDPVTRAPHPEVFEATLGSGVVCASCRADGSRPIGDSTLPPVSEARLMSDDGGRVFFQSTDALVPQAANRVQQIFQFSDGRVSPISRPDNSFAATFLDASVSGDDVFFETFDAGLVPGPNAGDAAVFDARVGGGFPVVSDVRCSGVACHASPTPAPNLTTPQSATFSGAGNVLASAPVVVTHVTVKKATKCKKGFVRQKSKRSKKSRCVKRTARKQRAGNDRRAKR